MSGYVTPAALDVCVIDPVAGVYRTRRADRRDAASDMHYKYSLLTTGSSRLAYIYLCILDRVYSTLAHMKLRAVRMGKKLYRGMLYVQYRRLLCYIITM